MSAGVSDDLTDYLDQRYGPSPGVNGVRPDRETAAEQGTRLIRDRLLDATQFLDGWGVTAQPVWGDGPACLWASGEACTLAGGQGTGKTTLAAQLVHARLGLSSSLLGFPVAPTGRRVLYLAMDRPRQIARAMRRTFGDSRPDGLIVWPGPPLADLAKHPETLLTFAEAADADTVVVDSIKDAAIGLSDDAVGAGYNRARQYLLTAGVELLELHHTIKRNAAGGKPRELEDVYGSVWLTSGSGSVILLDGKAGDSVVTLHHLKQPADEVGPLQVLHDHTRGRSTVVDQVDLVEVARQRGGITANSTAVLLGSLDPDRNKIEQARRKLDRLADQGLLTRSPSSPPTPTTYTATYSRGTHAPLLGEGTHG